MASVIPDGLLTESRLILIPYPQVSDSGRFAVVHNGIIENYMSLKEYLINHGVEFVSETDTEVIAQLFEYYYDGDMLDTMLKVLAKVEGSYAIGVISQEHPDELTFGAEGQSIDCRNWRRGKLYRIGHSRDFIPYP